MIIKHTYRLILTLLVITSSVQAQVDGFWVVTKVTVGSQEMTPVAKWIKLDHEIQTSGNGWLQHTTGTFVYDKERSTLTFHNNNEPNDEFGAFAVDKPGRDVMQWTRMEDGENVVVELKRAKGIPTSPSDEIHGLWALQKALKSDVDITSQYNPRNKYTMFIQWTHNYVINTGTDKIRGLWYVHAHKPEVRFLRTGHEAEVDTWEIHTSNTHDGKGLVLKGLSDNNKEIVLVFRHLDRFPEE